MIDELAPYPATKDSEAQWLGLVPEHWRVRRLKSSTDHIVEQTSARQGDVYVALEHVESWTGHVRPVKVVAEFDSQVNRFRAGDVLFGKLRPYLAKVACADRDGVCVGEFLVLRPRHSVISPPFLEHLLRSKPVIDAVNSSTFGAKMPRADWGFVGGMRIAIPPLEEQARIVRFLEHADARIHRYIRAKQQLIKLLEEQKEAIVHRAVTRGLDPDVRLKPSGVEWLGEVPKHWDVRRLKRVGEVRIGLTYLPSDVAGPDGVLVLRASNVRDGKVVSGDNVYVSTPVPENLLVAEGDILICVRSGSRNLVGKSAVIPREFADATYGAFMTILRSELNPWLYWVLNSQLMPTVMAQFETSTINQLTQGDLRSLPIPIPSAVEQTEIVRYLQHATSSIESTIVQTRREINLLHEYRDRLIADVVTGKLDVRDVAAGWTSEVAPVGALEPDAGPDDADWDSEAKTDQVTA